MSVVPLDAVLTALREFAEDVKATADRADQIAFGAEDQLKRSVPRLVVRVGAALGLSVTVFSESPVDEVGRPDLAIAVDGLLVGYIELKAPGVGTTSRELRGRDRTQLNKFLNLPNLIYTDARDWTLYRGGERQRRYDVRLGGIDEIGASDITDSDASALLELLREFFHWQPIVPTSARGLAEQLAPLTRMIRTDVAEGISEEKPALSGIYSDWKRTLFPEATPDQFADAYAQTLTYGLLLAKLSGATALDTRSAARAIQHHSSLLARTLEILMQEETRKELGPGIDLLERTIDAVDPEALRGRDNADPWLYFYEDFLAVYDPKLRNQRGVYYTPVQVVRAQVTLVDELLRTKLNRQLGFADPDVTVLDPATGTGTYLLRVLQHGVERASAMYGSGARGEIASQMARKLYGFELLVGPYAVAHLRLAQAIQEAGGQEPEDGVHIYLTDTLESPNEIRNLPHSFYEKPLAEEHRRAREVKRNTPILVCIGNPPYEREESTSPNDTSAGGWIRFGDQATTPPPLTTFIEPALRAGKGGHVKNLYNLYVYFWRWALWKIFETQDGPGIVSFITASSYLRGPGFVGMREEMRRTFDELWIIDLEGDSRGTRRSENVFDIQTPVAIAVGARFGSPKRDQPANVWYTRIRGTRAEKFSVLSELTGFDDLSWDLCPEDWDKSFIPGSESHYFAWPALADLMPWRHSGVQMKRSWPIAESRDVLQRRWSKLISAPDRAALFRETRDRVVTQSYQDQLDGRGTLRAINSLPSDAPPPEIVRYGFRSFDRQFVFKDTRVGDRNRPPLWQSWSIRQIFLSSLFEFPLGGGPAVIATALVPDLHHFSGRGGKDIIPLYRDAAAKEPNVTRGLLALLEETYGRTVTPEDLIGYITCVLGHQGYTERFRDELEEPGPKVPLTKDAILFGRAVELGKRVIAWQTYAERFPESIGARYGQVPPGRARIKVAIPSDPDEYPATLQQDVRYDSEAQELHVGDGVIEHVYPRVWEYEVSGLRIVRSWLGYRMREPAGRKSSALDDIRPERWTWTMTKELLELLWVLEGVLALEPEQDALLGEILASELFLAEELPTPTDAERRAPRVTHVQQLMLDDTL